MNSCKVYRIIAPPLMFIMVLARAVRRRLRQTVEWRALRRGSCCSPWKRQDRIGARRPLFGVPSGAVIGSARSISACWVASLPCRAVAISPVVCLAFRAAGEVPESASPSLGFVQVEAPGAAATAMPSAGDKHHFHSQFYAGIQDLSSQICSQSESVRAPQKLSRCRARTSVLPVSIFPTTACRRQSVRTVAVGAVGVLHRNRWNSTPSPQRPSRPQSSFAAIAPDFDDAAIGHQDRILHFAVTVDAHAGDSLRNAPGRARQKTMEFPALTSNHREARRPSWAKTNLAAGKLLGGFGRIGSGGREIEFGGDADESILAS